MSTPVVHRFEIGPMDNFVYIIADPATQQCVFLDPAWDVPLLKRTVEENGYTPTAIWLTHGHHDHVNGIPEVLDSYSLPLWVSYQEASSLTPDVPYLRRITPGTHLTCGELTAICHITPGHTPGGVCFEMGDVLFTGDTLFVDGCGRCNFDNSNVNDMYDSLQLISDLSGSLEIHPGHSYGYQKTDTIEAQKKRNRFLLCKIRDEFISKRMGIRIQ